MVRVGDVSAINYGYTAKASVEDVGPKFLRITDIQNGGVDWQGVPKCPINDQDFKRHKLQSNDIVFARTGATTGKSFLIYNPPKAVAASYLIRLRIQDQKILPEFVALYFQTKEYWDTVIKGISGSAQGGFNASKLAELRLPLPPLPEQKRIVAILDEAFEGIAKAVANTEKNLANARELFESYLNSVFSQKGEGWGETTIGDSCDFFNGKAHEKIIDDDGDYIVVNSKFISSEGQVLKATNDALFPLKKDDIVMVMSDVPKGKALAKCYLIDKNDNYTLNQRICCIRSNVFNKRFLFYQLNRNPYLLAFDNKENQTNLRKGDILKCPLWVPNFEEQATIAEQLNDFCESTEKLESIYQQKLDALNELKQSLLQKAFSGQLRIEN